ncbi:phage integrase N-terminal SAM-like domain-containing protein [Dechloromonas sp. H13]|uniref:phage integrase N-terminal SAM-like domain-containing protein n=1 Tax=Dechloromonas sp. H13 TaxID=2570193 RepID=UPI001290C265
MDINQPPTLLGRVREVIRYKHYSIRTERTYVDWIRRFVNFHGRRHPSRDGGGRDSGVFSHLTSHLDVAVSTHQRALSALVFCTAMCLSLSCRGWRS